MPHKHLKFDIFQVDLIIPKAFSSLLCVGKSRVPLTLDSISLESCVSSPFLLTTSPHDQTVPFIKYSQFRAIHQVPSFLFASIIHDYQCYTQIVYLHFQTLCFTLLNNFITYQVRT